MKWTEGHIHIAMRNFLRDAGWTLVAGEYPGGSDHELYPLNVVDPTVARDFSPDPRRHSLGELIPDLVAVKDRDLIICEAKPRYSVDDEEKLLTLLGARRADLLAALNKFAVERGYTMLLPVGGLNIHPVLVFHAGAAPAPKSMFSYLRVFDMVTAHFEGHLAQDI